MENTIVILNIIMIFIFIVYVLFITSRILQHKKNRRLNSEDVIVINETKDPSYVEGVTNKVFLVIGTTFFILSTWVTFSEGLDKNILPIYIPLLFMDLWRTNFNKQSSFIIHPDGLEVGLEFIKWKAFSGYEWSDVNRLNNKSTLRIKKRHNIFSVSVVIHNKDKNKVEALLNKYL